MTSISKILLTCAVAVAAIAISSAPSEAAKKKKAAAPCLPGPMCSSGNNVNYCGIDGKWYKAQVTPTCVQPWCPPKCG
jgi:hypothetical protein